MNTQVPPKDLPQNRFKFVAHGFFYNAGIMVAEPSTILTLIVDFFGGSSFLIGIFSSLLRGGAVFMQMVSAFYAQSYKKVINHLRFIFVFRFIAWMSIGASIYYFGLNNPVLTLWLIGIGLFSFSFSAGFGTVYFQELLGKIFTNNYRGVTIAYRQIFMGLGGIFAAFAAGYTLKSTAPPLGFAYTFLVSGLVMAMGYIFLGTVKEPVKENVSIKENSFSIFLMNAVRLLKTDKKLRIQIIARLSSFSYLLSLPFIIKSIKIDMSLGGLALGSAIPLLTGSMLGNVIWLRLAKKGFNKSIIIVSILFLITGLVLAIDANSIWKIILLFFLAGSGADGLKIGFINLILSIAPEKKRPVYIAVQNNIGSLGLFFSIPGGILLTTIGYYWLLTITLLTMVVSFFLALKLKNE